MACGFYLKKRFLDFSFKVEPSSPRLSWPVPAAGEQLAQVLLSLCLRLLSEESGGAEETQDDSCTSDAVSSWPWL